MKADENWISIKLVVKLGRKMPESQVHTFIDIKFGFGGAERIKFLHKPLALSKLMSLTFNHFFLFLWINIQVSI
jgi:hypothetical protein